MRRRIIASTAIVAALAAPTHAEASSSPTVTVAHRGYLGAGAPENSHAAFRHAIQRGYGGIEFDVRFTSDKRAVILHDTTLDRTSTNCTGPLKSYTLAQVKQCDISTPTVSGRVADLYETMGYIHTLSQQYSWEGAVLVHVKETLTPSLSSGIQTSISRIWNEERRVIFLTESDADAVTLRETGWDGKDEGKTNVRRSSGPLVKSTDVERIGQMVHTSADWESLQGTLFDVAVPYAPSLLSLGYDATVTEQRLEDLAASKTLLIGMEGLPQSEDELDELGVQLRMI